MFVVSFIKRKKEKKHVFIFPLLCFCQQIIPTDFFFRLFPSLFQSHSLVSTPENCVEAVCKGGNTVTSSLPSRRLKRRALCSVTCCVDFGRIITAPLWNVLLGEIRVDG